MDQLIIYHISIANLFNDFLVSSMISDTNLTPVHFLNGTLIVFDVVSTEATGMCHQTSP